MGIAQVFSRADRGINIFVEGLLSPEELAKLKMHIFDKPNRKRIYVS
jgi:hypothetical protein